MRTRADPDRPERPRTAGLRHKQSAPPRRLKEIATMAWIIALVLLVIIALSILGFAVHLLFSPWLLVAVAIVAWIKFRPGRAGR